jgi:hypothetical protein
MNKAIPWPEIIGKVLVTSAMQATFGNLELPSRILMRNFITTQEDADAFISEVYGYLMIGGLWAIGTTFLMFVMHQYLGAILNMIFQLVAMNWIISRRYAVYISTAKKHNLQTKSII